MTEFLAFIHPAEVDRMSVSWVFVSDIRCNHAALEKNVPFSLKKDFTIEDVLDEYDTDKDGFISLSEFIGDVRGDGEAI